MPAGAVGKTHNWRQVSGAFQVRIPVTTSAVMLPLEASTLAVLKWRLATMPTMSRWRPVLERYVQYVSERVDGLGGNANNIPPSLEGAPPESGPDHRRPHEQRRPFEDHEQGWTGKVIGVVYDRFGDFAGFRLLSESGDERSFRSREDELGELVHQAWTGRYLITVYVEEPDSDWAAEIVFRRAPDR
jgi:hypothetical protein